MIMVGMESFLIGSGLVLLFHTISMPTIIVGDSENSVLVS